MMPSRIRASLRITGFECDSDQITRLLGTTPSRYWVAGDLVPNTPMVRPTNGWELISDLEDDRELDAHVENILSKIGVFDSGKIQKLNGIALISVALYTDHNDRPPLFLSKKSIQALSHLQTDLDIDLYFDN